VRIDTALVAMLLAAAVGCGGGGMASEGGSSLALSLANSAVQVFQGQSSVTVNAKLTRSGSTGTVALTVSGLPQGATDQIQSPRSGSSGSLLVIDGKTSAADSPTAAAVTPVAQMTISLGGYGVEFLTLKP